MAWMSQEHQMIMRTASCGFPAQAGFSVGGGQLQSSLSLPSSGLPLSDIAAHQCTRFCHFDHQFGNLYICKTSGKSHVCDQTCAERVRVDPYTTVCRLSRKTFNNPVQERQNSLKRCADDMGSDPPTKRASSNAFDVMARC